MITRGKKRFKRFCKKCGEYFQPVGIDSYTCFNCYNDRYKNLLKNKKLNPFKDKLL